MRTRPTVTRGVRNVRTGVRSNKHSSRIDAKRSNSGRIRCNGVRKTSNAGNSNGRNRFAAIRRTSSAGSNNGKTRFAGTRTKSNSNAGNNSARNRFAVIRKTSSAGNSNVRIKYNAIKKTNNVGSDSDKIKFASLRNDSVMTSSGWNNNDKFRSGDVGKNNSARLQNWRYNDYGPYNYRYRRGGSYYETNQYGAQMLQRAINDGYEQGFQAGQADREDGWGYNPNDAYGYQDATYGYDGYYVDLGEYQYYFREGFRRGYEDGYYSRSRYGNYSNGKFSILGAILTGILGLELIN
jgi:hypothetical protein